MFHEDILYISYHKLNFWLVICIAKNLIWTTLKVIFSIFRFFCTLRFQIYKYCSIITNHTSMQSYLFSVQMMHKSQFPKMYWVLCSRVTINKWLDSVCRYEPRQMLKADAVTALMSLSSQSLRGIWSQQMFSSSWVTSSWRLESRPMFAPVRLIRRSRVPLLRPGPTPSSPVSSASSAPATCRVCADITATGTEERSSSNARTAPSSPATSKNHTSDQGRNHHRHWGGPPQ